MNKPAVHRKKNIIVGIIVVIVLFVFIGYTREATFAEKDVVIDSYKQVTVDKKLKDVAVLKDEQGFKYETGFSCLNGSQPVGSKISIYTEQDVKTYGFFFKTETYKSVKSGASICIKY